MRTTSTAHGSSLRLLAHAATAIGLLCLGFRPTGAVAYTPVIDNAGALKLSNLPEISAESGTFVVVASPGTPSSLLDAQDADVPLASSADYLICRGATLLGTSEADRVSLGTCSLVAGAIVLDGVTDGDLQAGLADSRHGRTLTALFRARLQFAEEGPQSKQTLIFAVQGEEDSIDNDAVVKDVHTLFQAVSAEREESLTFEDCYDIFITSADDKNKVRQLFAGTTSLPTSCFFSHLTPTSSLRLFRWQLLHQRQLPPMSYRRHSWSLTARSRPRTLLLSDWTLHRLRRPLSKLEMPLVTTPESFEQNLPPGSRGLPEVF